MIAEDQTGAAAFRSYALLMLVVIPIGYLCFGLATRLSHITAFHLIHDLRMRMARHLARLTMGQVAGMRSGTAKQTIISEPEKLELMIAHAIPEGSSALVSWALVTGWLFYVDWRLALASVVLTPIAFVCMALAIRMSFSKVQQVQNANLAMNDAIAEFMAGLPVVKIFNAEFDDRTDLANTITRFADMQSAMGRAFVPLGGTFYALILANITVILTVGVWLMAAGKTDLTTLLFFVILGANYSTPLMRLFDLFHHFAHISLSAVSAHRILSAAPQHDSGDNTPLADTTVRFENVGFAYDTSPVLHGVSFVAGAGQTTALVGPSGSGKSTLARLVPRLHEIDSGQITIGGRDLRDIGLSRLTASVAVVFQNPFLFSASIADNIRLGNPDASDQQVAAAATAACADQFITKLPAGYDTIVGQGAQLLSGGERQRIAIAAALLKDAPIVVLDEATAFADPDSEADIQDAISALTRDKTLIIIAHRLHTIIGADRIVVLDRGQVVQQGRHDTLHKSDGLYAQMWRDYTAAQEVRLKPTETGDVRF